MTVTMHRTLILGIAVVSFVGCMNADQPHTSEKPPCAHPLQIALLGDQTRVELLTQLAEASNADVNSGNEQIIAAATINDSRVTITTNKSNNVAAHASTCSVADLAVIAVDARNGPMPVHREHILFARQMHVPAILIAFTHSNAIGDPELLELEELEMREMLNTYGWKGDEAIVAYDFDKARVAHFPGAVKGARALACCLSQVAARPEAPPSVKSSECAVEVYALAEQEAHPLKTTGISSGAYTVILGTATPKAKVQLAATIGPGKTGSARLIFDSPLSVYSGQRCTILTADHVVAVGVIGGRETPVTKQKAIPQDSPGIVLRQMVLTTPPSKLTFSADEDYPIVYGVLTEWDIDGVTATVMSMRDGTASLYTTSAFGIIGGQGHQSVREAAARYVKRAGQYVGSGKVVAEFAYPRSGQVYYYLLTYDGVRQVIGNEASIERGLDPTRPLFAAAQDVLTELRLVTQQKNPQLKKPGD